MRVPVWRGCSRLPEIGRKPHASNTGADKKEEEDKEEGEVREERRDGGRRRRNGVVWWEGRKGRVL